MLCLYCVIAMLLCCCVCFGGFEPLGKFYFQYFFQYFSFTICEAFSYIVLKITKIVAQLPTD